MEFDSHYTLEQKAVKMMGNKQKNPERKYIPKRKFAT